MGYQHIKGRATAFPPVTAGKANHRLCRAFTDRIESGIKTTVKDKISHPQTTYLLCEALKGFDVSFAQGGSGNGTIHYLYYSSTYQLISL